MLALAAKQDTSSNKSTEQQAADSTYWDALDGVRALAVGLVFFHHVGPFPGSDQNSFATCLNRVAQWGWIGVDLFFVLSGFLITFLLVREKQTSSTVSIKNFYVRRALRIWPLYYAILFLAFIVVPATAPQHPSAAGWAEFLLRVGAPFAFFAGNYATMLDFPAVSYFEQSIRLSTPWILGILAPLWSLSIEEQFYLAWPWVVQRIPSVKTLIGLILIIWAATATIRLLILSQLGPDLITPPHVWYYMNTIARLDPLMAGSLLACIVATYSGFVLNSIRKYCAAGLFVVLGLPTLIAVFPNISQVSSVHFFTLLLVSLLGLSLTALCLSPGPVQKIFANPVLTFIGRRSYAFYLLHHVVIMFVSVNVMNHIHLAKSSSWGVKVAISFVVTVLLSHLSFIWIESPFLALRKQFRK